MEERNGGIHSPSFSISRTCALLRFLFTFFLLLYVFFSCLSPSLLLSHLSHLPDFLSILLFYRIFLLHRHFLAAFKWHIRNIPLSSLSFASFFFLHPSLALFLPMLLILQPSLRLNLLNIANNSFTDFSFASAQVNYSYLPFYFWQLLNYFA